MIKLMNVSKYYHSEDAVVMGLRKVSIEFNIGEFIAITGESGSGKSTLLNVISGNDTYEEGELYINGEETSHFENADWENYRRNYIGFIFQTNNLIDSYTVLENVVAALLIQGLDHKRRIEKAKAIIERVGLTSHIKHKAIKLSGGQKQRLAIARALAKDAPIIVADEPTGNLDSESGKDIIKLLNEVSKDKLVILVTHNFDQAKEYVTRKVRLYDGEVVEDIELKEAVKKEKIDIEETDAPVFKKALIFGLLNLKSQPRRTFLIVLVALITTLFIFNLFGGYLKSQDISDSGSSMSYNVNAYKERIIVSKKDKSLFNTDDYQVISSIDGVNRIIKQDLALDVRSSCTFNAPSGTRYGFYGYNYPVEFLKKSDLTYGDLPTSNNEIVIKRILYSDMNHEDFLNTIQTVSISSGQFSNSSEDDSMNLKIVGFIESETYDTTFYMSESILNTINNKMFEFYNSEDLPEFFNPEDYESLSAVELSSDEEYHQFTVEASYKNIDDVVKKLLDNGYYAYSPFKATSGDGDFFNILAKTFMAINSIVSIVIVYFVAYLIFKNILLSKKKDYAILKSIGIDQKSIRFMNFTELYIAFLIAFVLQVPIYLLLAKIGIVSLELFLYYEWYHFVVLLLINTLICILLVRRYNKLLIKNSILNNMRIE